MFLALVNSFGLFFSFLGLATFRLIYKNAPSLVDRTTLRLQAALCFIDLLSHIQMYFGSDYSPSICSFIGFAGVYISSVYLTITASMTLCFHINLLSSKKVKAKLEKFLWLSIFIFVLPILHTVPPYVLGKFGLDENDCCFIKSNVAYHEFMLYYLAIVPTLLVYVYCLVIIFFVVMRIKSVNDVLVKITDCREISDDNRNLMQKILDSWMSRFVMYPVAFILINSGLIVDFILKTMEIQSTAVFYWTATCLSLQGLFHYIALMIDPYFIDAFIEIMSFKCSKFVQNWKKEYRDELARAEAAIVQHEEYIFGSNFDNRAWEEHEAKALLQKCTRNF